MESKGFEEQKPKTRWSTAMPGGLTGLVLFICLFLPSVESCSGDVIVPAQVLADSKDDDPTTTFEELVGVAYGKFLLVWPYFFGIGVAVVSLLAQRFPSTLQLVWIAWLWLIAMHATLFSIFFAIHLSTEEEPPTVADFSMVPITLATVVAALFTLRCRSWFNATMWMEAMLGLVAAVNLSTFSLAILLSQRVLFGWQLALGSSLCISIHGLVMRMAGAEVVLPKFEPRPRFQLSLRNMLILMLVGGIACAWMISGLMLNEAHELAKQKKLVAQLSSNVTRSSRRGRARSSQRTQRKNCRD